MRPDFSEMSRRNALTLMTTAAGTMLTGYGATAETVSEKPGHGRLRQSACRWCYGRIKLDELAQAFAGMGLDAMDLLDPDEWPVVAQHGVTCSMANGPGGIRDGWNSPDNHEKLIAGARELMPQIAAAGIKNMIVFSGNRAGRSDEDGLLQCARGLEKILPEAEALGLTVFMELLNSKRDHRDYQCDRTAWGAALVKQLATKHFKLLYDIYHMQLMEGDIIATIREYYEYIGHFHTGGVPGRNEIDDTQELNYRRIAEAIAELGFTGYFAHEFIPKRDPLTSLQQAIDICAV